MNYNALRYFSVLARHEHYGRAAEELGISQPSLSAAISRLEEELGIYLFEKSGRNVRLTYYGQQYREYVDQALALLSRGEDLMTKWADRERGIVRIGAFSSAGPGRLIPLIHRFHMQHPQVQFHYTGGTASMLREGLKREEFDFIVSAREDPDPDLSYYPLWRQRFVVIVPEHHPLSVSRELTLEQIASFPLIRYHRRAATGSLVDGLFRDAQITPQTCCEVSDDYHLAEMVSAGLGIAVMPDSPMTDRYGLLRIPLKETGPVNRDLFLVTKQGAYISESAHDFIRMLKNEF